MNDYDERRLLELFEASGFRCTRRDRWESQGLYALTLDEPGVG
jgi:hypothetical protein